MTKKSLKYKQEHELCRKCLQKNLSKVVIHENKPRPAARGRSQNNRSEGCKEFSYLFVKHCSKF